MLCRAEQATEGTVTEVTAASRFYSALASPPEIITESAAPYAAPAAAAALSSECARTLTRRGAPRALHLYICMYASAMHGTLVTTLRNDRDFTSPASGTRAAYSAATRCYRTYPSAVTSRLSGILRILKDAAVLYYSDNDNDGGDDEDDDDVDDDDDDDDGDVT